MKNTSEFDGRSVGKYIKTLLDQRKLFKINKK